MDPNERTMQEPPTVGEHKGFEVYPMPMFALLECQDVERSKAWYVAALGFGDMFTLPGPDGKPGMVHLRRRKYQDLMLVPRTGDAAATRPTLRLMFDASGEVTALWERARGADGFGHVRVEEPRVTAWNTRDLHVTDPDGHALVFSERHDDPEVHVEWARRFEEDRRSD